MNRILVEGILAAAAIGLSAWLGNLQFQVVRLQNEIAEIREIGAVTIARIAQCERLASIILDQEEANDGGGERIATELFEKRGCNEMVAK